jgi:leader peptidase (prepilin peptidase)/N-methyltransferase
MIRILATAFAGLLGLAFGSFLNVCLSRWPEGESIVHPRSHCRNCDHTLAWWENIPLASWLFLRGRCRNCGTSIGLRYPLVELSVGVVWGIYAWQTSGPSFEGLMIARFPLVGVTLILLKLVFYWLLVALAALDADHLWLPDWLTFPGIALGLFNACAGLIFGRHMFIFNHDLLYAMGYMLGGILAAASLILIIRWLYKLLRHRDGIGLGDAKLMALLAAWLGISGALLAFALGSILGALAALLLLATPSARTNPQNWATSKLPLGTFLCMGGIVSSLWGQPIIAAYLHWAGF